MGAVLMTLPDPRNTRLHLDSLTRLALIRALNERRLERDARVRLDYVEKYFGFRVVMEHFWCPRPVMIVGGLVG